MTELTVNGKQVAVPDGVTLLEAVRAAGAKVPTLCHHQGLEPYGACRLCLASLLAPRRELVACCARPAEAGMVLDTETPEAVRARRLTLEFLLGRCSGSVKIRELAAGEGITTSRFASADGADSEPPCALCGLCVRVCREAIGASALAFVGRGSERKVGTAFDLHADDCIGCGACAELCPTGAIRVEDRAGRRTLRAWNTTLELEPCPVCGGFFAPRALSSLTERFPELGDGWRTCPACRRRRTALQWLSANPSRD